MAIQQGTVREVKSDGVVIDLGAFSPVRLTAVELQSLGAEGLQVGERVRLTLRDSKVVKLARLGAAPALSAPEIAPTQQPKQTLVQVLWVDAKAQAIEMQTDEGKLLYKPHDLPAQTWNWLRPGLSLTLTRWPDGRAELEVPAAESVGDSSEPNLPEPHSPWHTGIVQSIEIYTGTVKADGGGVYSFIPGLFAALSLREEDRVQFQADEASRQIAKLNLLERALPGQGWENPCAASPTTLFGLSESKSIHQLVQHFCGEKRLQWYWVIPRSEPHAEPASLYLRPEVIQSIRHSVPDFETLYRHQIRALEALKQGRHVMVLTPTASGKTYCYNPAIFTAIAGDPSARALYVFPLNALLRDQLSKLNEISDGLRSLGKDVRVAHLVGGVSRAEHDAILQQPPNILAVNPEMLSFLLQRQNEGRLGDLFSNLRHVVLDEAHAYRSVFGMHMAGLTRRLQLACRRHGNPDVQFILSSATVGDATSLAQGLTGLDPSSFEFIPEQDNGAAQPLRHWMMLDPSKSDSDDSINSHLALAAEALADVLTVPQGEKLNAILFVRTFRELRYVYKVLTSILTDRNRRDLLSKVAQYAGGLLDDERKEAIYTQLKNSVLRAVVATNALEAGIDLGALDVCILAGFPYHAMRMRQMAGRAGRRREGAVIFIPDLSRATDRYYYDRPTRLITQPPEVFVIDAGNPYVARKHVVAEAASVTSSGGLKADELPIFGDRVQRITDEAIAAKVLRRDVASYKATLPARGTKWAVDRIRGNEQDPYVVCKASGADRRCVQRTCLATAQKNDSSQARCEHLVQLLDRQFVYRETHPGAIFEDIDGNFYACESLDESYKVIYVRPLPGDPFMRTFPLEEVDIEILRESARRPLANGAQLIWGDVRVTRVFHGYGQYALISRRRCRRCRKSYDDRTRVCPSCSAETHLYIEHTEPEYMDYPPPYSGKMFTIEIETIACWLTLPARIEGLLQAVAPCPILSPRNRVADFLRTEPPFTDAADLSRVTGIASSSAPAALDYFRQWYPHTHQLPPAKDQVWVHPSVYGQCLHHHLREHLPEEGALLAFEQATGYPVTQDTRHICRRCFGGVLLLAAHTLEHIVAQNYPVLALGDSQDLGSTTLVSHPQTGETTVFWFDAYEGGIGAAEKLYSLFESLVDKAHASLECKCHKDEGCPVCTELPKCDRHNAALSKNAAVGLTHALLGLEEFIPREAVFWPKDKAEAGATAAHAAERAKGEVPLPNSSTTTEQVDPYLLLRVQRYVHDLVLARVLEIRGEEAMKESPPIPIGDLLAAYKQVQQSQRPGDWRFESQWSPYEILHIQTAASTRLAKAAFLTIVKAVHPDRNAGNPWATVATQTVNGAWKAIKEERGESNS